MMSPACTCGCAVDDPVRRQGLAAMLEAAGHMLVDDTPDVVLCDLLRRHAAARRGGGAGAGADRPRSANRSARRRAAARG